MKLRQRTLLCIGLTVLGLVIGVYLLSSDLLLASYRELEKRETQRNVERVTDAIQQQVTDFHDKSSDWSNWDDTYKFIKDRNEAYVDSNLSVVTLKLDVMLFLDSKGRIVYSNELKRRPGVTPPSGEKLREALGFDDPARIPNPNYTAGGLIRWGTGFMIVSVRPIVPTAANKPPRGWMVFALNYDAVEMQSLSSRTHLNISIQDLHAAQMSNDCLSAHSEMVRRGDKILARPLDENNIAGYTHLDDIFKKPISMLKVSETRAIYRQGVASVRYLTQFMAIAGIVFGIVVLLLFEVSALNRVFKLSNQVERASKEVDTRSRIHLSGDDELSWLAGKINGMLEALRDNQISIRTQNADLERTVDALATTNAVLANAVEGISELDAWGYYISVNASFAKTLGYERADLIGKHWSTTVAPAYHEAFRRAIEEMVIDGKAEVEVQGRCKLGSLFYQETVMIASYDEGHEFTGHHCFIKDISERKQLENQIEHQAFHDGLTGLPNRALFMDRLAQAQARARRHQDSVAVIFLDLDNFKIINDSLGHEAGDDLLVAISARLSDCVRPEDTVARLGGDEFTVLLQEMHSPAEAASIAERIVEAMRQPILLSHGETFASCSIGIAYSESGSDSPEGLLRDADTAMYHAKANGKAGYVMFDAEMNAKAVERMELEMGLRHALARNEFSLYYQPILDLSHGTVTGVEALLRWNHPTRGIISPAAFIPIAEETGLIAPIGHWALREACRQGKAWHDEFPSERPLTINVNLSGRQLQRPDIVKQVSAVLEESGLDPAYLKLEITESILMHDVSETVDRLQTLKEAGIKLAIDDFGTGYSSMSSLSSFPVDTIKIDRFFIASLAENSEAAAVVAAIIMLAKTLKLDITAEGLETDDQLTYLLAMGCTTAQGYFFSPPLSAEDFRERLASGFDFAGRDREFAA